MSITCKFELTRVSNIYYSGEDITGSVTICCLKQRQIEAIILEFCGQSTVECWELDKSTDNIMHNDFSTKEVAVKTRYSNQQKHVCEQLKLDSTYCQQLQPYVEYTINFCFQIPKHVPATCRYPYGSTEYALKLQMQHAKKVNKEFHQRIVVKNKLDLTLQIKYKEPHSVYQKNNFGQITLQVPCTGFTPGQKIPYHFAYQTTQTDCKLLLLLNCYITCRPQNDCDKFKQIKQIINYKKHLLYEASSVINIPLHCQISCLNNDELILRWGYTLDAVLINGHKKPLLTASVPLVIGTTPCFTFDEMKPGINNYMCYDNYGSYSLELASQQSDPNISDLFQSVTDQIYESLWILPIKRKTHLRKSLRYCYKKLIKLI